MTRPFRLPPRRLATKIVAVVLVAGLLPFLVAGLWTWSEARTRMTSAVAESWLVRVARETAAQVDREVDRMREAATSWAEEESTAAEARAAAAPGIAGGFAAQRLATALGRRAQRFGDVPFVGVLDGEARRILASSGSERTRSASSLAGRRLAEFLEEPAERAWIEAALGLPPDAPPSTRDWHRSPLADAAASVAEGDVRRHEVGFAAPIRGSYAEPGAPPVGVLVVLFRFAPIQSVLDQVQRRFAEIDPEERGARNPRYPSGYPFLFASDADTVVAHRDRALLGTSLVKDHGQAGLRDAMRARPYGFHHYEYPPGTGKVSGFARCADADRGGFGWIVGVGVNHADVFADADRLRDVLAVGGLVVAGLAAVLAALFASRVAEPLRRLVLQTERLARGDYDARVEVRSRDEMAVLADAFNRLAAELKESGRRLVEAEKSAAWKEMARQVAHEIKNPLTPIMLAAQQIDRARVDRHPRFDEIVAESTRSIVEQCASLKRIAQNFANFAAFPQSRKTSRAFARLVADAVRLYAPDRPEGPRVVVVADVPEDVRVMADEDELRRVFLNLFNNAFEATPPSGEIRVTATVEGTPGAERAVVKISDTGRGVAEEDRARLFEPYFSTRSGGTGLGLAICRKIMQEHRGDVAYAAEPGRGATFVVSLPAFREGAGPPESSADPFGETRTVLRG